MPVLSLHVLLLPINVLRLAQIEKMRKAGGGADFPDGWGQAVRRADKFQLLTDRGRPCERPPSTKRQVWQNCASSSRQNIERVTA